MPAPRATAPILRILTAGLACLPICLAEEPGASGLSLSYIHLFEGEMRQGGRDLPWSQGMRVELQFRDYYFPQSNHHPFYELGFLLERHEGGSAGVSVDAETIGIKAAIGTAIPLWHDGSHHAGLAPQLAFHLGRMTLDSSTGAAHMSDEATRVGTSLGLDAWAALGGTVTIGAGPFLSYWRARDIEALNGTGATTTAAASGWDLGARVLVGVIF